MTGNTDPPEDDSISVEEIKDIYKKTELFIQERGSPKVNIIWLANLILKRLMNDRDYYINISGTKGQGKSNFILLLTLLQSRFSGIWKNKKTGKLVKVLPRLKPLPEPWEQLTCGFSFKNNISFLDEADTIQQKFNALSKYSGFIIDEGSKSLHKLQWQTKLTFLLVKMSDTQRFQNKAVYVCFPNFKELNSTFRNDRIMMQIYVYDRNLKEHYASAIISLRDENRWLADKWHLDENAKLYEQLLKRIPMAVRTPSNILYAEKKLAGYAGNFDIPSLEYMAPRIWGIYMKYKIYYAQKDQSGITLTEDSDSTKVKNLKVQLFNGISFIQEKFPDMPRKEIADIFQLSYNSFNKIYNEFKQPIITPGKKIVWKDQGSIPIEKNVIQPIVFSNGYIENQETKKQIYKSQTPE